MTRNTWRKPSRKWGKRRKSISLLFDPIRVEAIDRRCEELSAETGIKINRSMIANNWADNDEWIAQLEKQVKKEQRDAKRRQRERTARQPAA